MVKAKLPIFILQSKDARFDFERKKDGSFKRDKYGVFWPCFMPVDGMW